MNKVTIFYKVYMADAEWLKFSLRSIVKFAKGFDSVVVVSDTGEPRPPIGSMEKHFYVTVPKIPYTFQQIVKVNADAYTDNQFIMYMDADVCLTRDLNAQDLLIGGMPIWLKEPFFGMDNPDVLKRQAELTHFIGQPVEYEFMRRHPFIIDREALVEMRRFCWRQHGMSIEDYMFGMSACSEFNLCGAFQYHYRRATVAWRRPDEVPVYLRQDWSHGGLTDTIKQELERLTA